MDSRSNTVARFMLLKKALEGAKNIPSSLLSACRSQGSFAKFSNPAAGIEAMALNTLKSSADLFIEDGGWTKLDLMRKNYLTAGKIKTGQTDKIRKKTNLQKDKLTRLAAELDGERRYRIRLQIAYGSLLNQMRSMAKNNPEMGHFINRHVAAFSFKHMTVVSKEVDDENE